MAKSQSTYVFIDLEANGKFVPAGKLTTYEDARLSYATFQYGKKYLQRTNVAPIDPHALPLPGDPDLIYRTEEGFALFGAIRDAAPDGWGRHLLDRWSGRVLSEFEYVVTSGDSRIGALAFGPSPLKGPERLIIGGKSPIVGEHLNLSELAEQAARIQEDDGPLNPQLERFVERGSSLGGARPKADTLWNKRRWLAKFARRDDKFNAVRAEFATMKLAAKCGLNCPSIDLQTFGGRDIFLIERFDRTPKGGRRHFVSALTMLGAHESESQRKSYIDIAASIRQHSNLVREDLRELFRRMVLNILCHNSDDHLRNHGFIRDQLHWQLAPLYDVTPIPVAGESRDLAIGVGKEGRAATLANALTCTDAFGINREDAKQEIEQMRFQIRDWRDEFTAAGIGTGDLERLSTCFRALDEQI